MPRLRGKNLNQIIYGGLFARNPESLGDRAAAQAASSMVAALLLLLVANVLPDCFMLYISGATLQQSTSTNAACQRHWCLRPS